MLPAEYKSEQLCVEGVSLAEIDVPLPAYVYSKAAIQENAQKYLKTMQTAFPGKKAFPCYAVKANSNLAILHVLAQQGCGFDIVSEGELARVLKAGGDPSKVVFSGVGKRYEEVKYALEQGIYCFNIESEPEIYLIQQVAVALNKPAHVSLRVNPNVDAKTHPHISTGLYNNKFGVLIDDAVRLYQLAAKQSHLEVVGVDCHIGSQLTDIKPFTDAFKLVIDLVDDLKSAGIVLKHIDIGGGVGVGYKPDQALISLPDYFAVVSAAIGDRTLDVICEPGRSIIAETGLLLTSVQFLKHTPVKHFAIVSAAMNDLIRPALYDSYHEILPVSTNVDTERIRYEWDIVGPVCESADFLGKGRSLNLKPGDRLAVMTAGAYGMCMASNYNSRPFLAEYLISGQSVEVIRKRQTNEDMWALERIPASLSSA